MKQDWNTTLTHLYGVISLSLGTVGLAVTLKSDSTFSEMALFASGWVVTIFLAVLLIRDYNRARLDGEDIGRLKESVRGLERELASRNQTLDFIAGLHVTQTALPRSTKQAAANNQPHNDGDGQND